MRSNVIDIIVYLVEHIRIGESLKEINMEKLRNYDRSEISAAYSWIMQKERSGELEKVFKRKKMVQNTKTPQRILHIAERMVITPEAYGFLLELMNIGLIDYEDLEKIIEKVMLHSNERVSLDKIKEIVTRSFFDNNKNPFNAEIFLNGDESIN